MAKKFSQFPSASSISPGDSVVGLKDGANTRFSFATFLSSIQSLFVPTSRKVNNKALSTDISLDASDVGAVDTADVGVADGVASLDSTGKVPSSQLPPIASTAADVTYDNTQSGLTADDVQEAIDELAQGGGGGGGSAANVTYDPTTSGASATNVQDALDEAFGDLDDKQNTITASGILKGDGQGGVTAAVAGTDYQAPLTAGTDYATPTQLEGKANQAQLAYVETGTTASRNYTAGQYISWNGLLYTADTAIASGATFYTSGGNKNLTECVGGGFNNLPFALKVQEFSFTTATLGTNFSQTSRAIDTTQNLFGIDATHICSIFVRDTTLTPAANMIFGIWGGTLYIATTQTCTLSNQLPIRIVVTYY